MSAITTHVLDTARGQPAAGMRVVLYQECEEGWKALGEGHTDANGRCNTLMGDGLAESGKYRLIFHTAAYFEGQNSKTFYPEVQVIFELRDPNAHYHVPLLISPFGYSTYRGS
jgi:5-hydroxyisourate hydrolase